MDCHSITKHVITERRIISFIECIKCDKFVFVLWSSPMISSCETFNALWCRTSHGVCTIEKRQFRHVVKEKQNYAVTGSY